GIGRKTDGGNRPTVPGQAMDFLAACRIPQVDASARADRGEKTSIGRPSSPAVRRAATVLANDSAGGEIAYTQRLVVADYPQRTPIRRESVGGHIAHGERRGVGIAGDVPKAQAMIAGQNQ